MCAAKLLGGSLDSLAVSPLSISEKDLDPTELNTERKEKPSRSNMSLILGTMKKAASIADVSGNDGEPISGRKSKLVSFADGITPGKSADQDDDENKSKRRSLRSLLTDAMNNEGEADAGKRSKKLKLTKALNVLKSMKAFRDQLGLNIKNMLDQKIAPGGGRPRTCFTVNERTTTNKSRPRACFMEFDMDTLTLADNMEGLPALYTPRVSIRPPFTAATTGFFSTVRSELCQKYRVPDFVKKPKMRIFVSFQEERCTMDIPHGKTVAEVKLMVQEKFFIQPNRIAIDGMDTEKNILVLSYAGAELGDDWILTDIGVSPGSTIHAYLKEELRPIVYIECGYNQETIQILEKFKFRDTFCSDLRAIASRKTGLPVGVFRLTKKGREMYDIHTLEMYEVCIGETLNLETWDGWNDFLNLAAMGFTTHALTKLSPDELVARYQMKVAMYIAAHFGHVDLAISLIRQGIRPDEPIGEHPYRQWCASNKHMDSLKCPVHEAVEAGQLGVLRTFVHHNICTVMAKDGNGLRPLNIALRNRVKPCASFLLTKQWSRINYGSTSIPLSLYAKMKAWGERGKEKALLIHGQDKSTLKRKPILEHPLVGQGVYVDGFSECQMATKAKAVTQADRERNRVLNFEPSHREFFTDDPELYFRNIGGPRKQGRFSRMLANVSKSKISTDDRSSEKSVEHTSRSPDKHPSSAASGNEQTDGREDGDRVRLPPIMEKGKRGSHAFVGAQGPSPTKEGRLPLIPKNKQAPVRNLLGSHDRDGSETPSSVKSVYIETGKDEGEKHKPKRDVPNTRKSLEDEEKEKKKRSRSAVLLAKAKTAEGAIPLPMNSIETIPKPIFHVKSDGLDAARSTLDSYERHRGMKSRDYAIKCLSVASTFKEKPWLHQVRLAMALTTQGVKKNVTAELGQREADADAMQRLSGLF